MVVATTADKITTTTTGTGTTTGMSTLNPGWCPGCGMC